MASALYDPKLMVGRCSEIEASAIMGMMSSERVAVAAVVLVDVFVTVVS